MQIHIPPVLIFVLLLAPSIALQIFCQVQNNGLFFWIDSIIFTMFEDVQT